jgi:arabinan endo-1,5-alpha-L-arabinosidase
MPIFTLDQIQIRDPFVLPLPDEQVYYLFGTTDTDAWAGPGHGFDCYRSPDLVQWEGPLPAFRPEAGFWGTSNFWAPEVHAYRGKFYLFASFIAPERYRGTQILVSDAPQGPYQPLTDGPVTPPEWQCLDGTLFVDEAGLPWMVFCHEWVQVHNGAVYAMPLREDLREAVGAPVFLFNASEAAWVKKPGWPAPNSAMRFPTYVTDGPFLFRSGQGTLLMLWSSLGWKGYAMGAARSTSGKITGPWVQQEQALWEEDGGHGMIFRAFDGRLFMTLHQPNHTPMERARFVEIIDCGDSIAVKGG